MNIVSGIVVFQLIWWLVFLMALPVGVKIDPNPGKGMATSSPLNPNLLKKAVITTILTLILWLMTFVIIDQEWINFR